MGFIAVKHIAPNLNVDIVIDIRIKWLQKR